MFVKRKEVKGVNEEESRDRRGDTQYHDQRDGAWRQHVWDKLFTHLLLVLLGQLGLLGQPLQDNLNVDVVPR